MFGLLAYSVINFRERSYELVKKKGQSPIFSVAALVLMQEIICLFSILFDRTKTLSNKTKVQEKHLA